VVQRWGRHEKKDPATASSRRWDRDEPRAGSAERLDDAIARPSLGRAWRSSPTTLAGRSDREDRVRGSPGCTCPHSFPICVCRAEADRADADVRPSLGEIGENPRVCSARLRAVERVAEGPRPPPDPERCSRPSPSRTSSRSGNDRRRTREPIAFTVAALLRWRSCSPRSGRTSRRTRSATSWPAGKQREVLLEKRWQLLVEKARALARPRRGSPAEAGPGPTPARPAVLVRDGELPGARPWPSRPAPDGRPGRPPARRRR
jgi:hypothetical protein